MTKRLMIVQVLLLAGLSLVFLLPQTPPMREAALRAELPTWVGGGWEGGSDLEASKEEREILAKDTEFFRRSYFRPVGGAETSLLDETLGATGGGATAAVRAAGQRRTPEVLHLLARVLRECAKSGESCAVRGRARAGCRVCGGRACSVSEADPPDSWIARTAPSAAGRRNSKAASHRASASAPPPPPMAAS